MARNGIDTNKNSAIQRFFDLNILIEYQCLIGISIWILKGRFFDTIIDFTYVFQVQQWECDPLITITIDLLSCSYYVHMLWPIYNSLSCEPKALSSIIYKIKHLMFIYCCMYHHLNISLLSN